MFLGRRSYARRTFQGASEEALGSTHRGEPRDRFQVGPRGEGLRNVGSPTSQGESQRVTDDSRIPRYAQDGLEQARVHGPLHH